MSRGGSWPDADPDLAAHLDHIEGWVSAELIHPGAGEKNMAVAQTTPHTSSPGLYLVPLPELLCLYRGS